VFFKIKFKNLVPTKQKTPNLVLVIIENAVTQRGQNAEILNVKESEEYTMAL